ncbi:MAG: hypothetical protein K2X47_13670 [Bdellovibrionales bacterium]|nr:hypothetical protein [Bdellovibrionales bacterium]
MRNLIVSLVLGQCLPLALAFGSSYEEKPLADCGQFQLIAVTTGSMTPDRRLTTSISHVLRFTNWQMDIPMVETEFRDFTRWTVTPGAVRFPVSVAVFKSVRSGLGYSYEADLPTMSPHSSPIYSRVICKEL